MFLAHLQKNLCALLYIYYTEKGFHLWIFWRELPNSTTEDLPFIKKADKAKTCQVEEMVVGAGEVY